jgi:hypothetical protein
MKKEKTKFQILKPSGEVVTTHEIDLSKVKSPDPLAYSYGLVQGERGEPLGKRKDLAPEYIRGWKEGHEKLKSKKIS